MPWRGPDVDGQLPSLGWDLLDWWSDILPSPRDPDEPLVFTNEQALILVAWYTINPTTGRFIHRRGCSRRSKGFGKSPMEAAKAIAELAGPVRFDGWNAQGNPVGRPWGLKGDPSAWVQLAAVSEDQVENTHSVVYEFLTANDGHAAEELKIDVGLTRSYLRDGAHRGKLEPVTASAGSREGQPITYGEMDETGLWNMRNGGVRLARTIRRNVAKMDGRSYETTNAFEPGQGSVAEATHQAALSGARGLFYDAVEAPHVDLETASDDEILAALAVAYGDSYWVDLPRLVVEAKDPDMPREDVERYFFNWNRKGGGKAIDPDQWAKFTRADRVVADGERIGLGFDGSISQDATALVGCTADGHLFELQIWERPINASSDWRIPRLEVERAVEAAFERYQVGRMYCDPPKWQTEIERWMERYNAGRKEADAIVIFFDTNQPRRMSPACDRFLTAMAEEFISHDGSSLLTAHVLAMSKEKAKARDPDNDGRSLYIFTKGEDHRKIDGGIAAVLALSAAMTMPEVVVPAVSLVTWR